MAQRATSTGRKKCPEKRSAESKPESGLMKRKQECTETSSVSSEKLTKSERNRLYYEKNKDRIRQKKDEENSTGALSTGASKQNLSNNKRKRTETIEEDNIRYAKRKKGANVDVPTLDASLTCSRKLTKSEKNRLYYETNKDRIKENRNSERTSAGDAKLTKAEINRRYYEKNKDKLKEARIRKQKDQVKNAACAGTATITAKLTKAEINRRHYEKNKDKIKQARIRKHKDPVEHAAKLAKNRAAYAVPEKRMAKLAAKRKAYKDPIKHAAELARGKAAYAVPEKRIARLASKRKFRQNPVNHALILAQRRILYQNQKTQGKKSPKTNKKDKNSDYDYLLTQARKAMLEMPVLACTVCHRARFKEQVKVCNRNKYPQSEKVLKCFTGKYIHQCSTDCNDSSGYHDKKKKEWICFTCHRHLLKGNVPPQAVVNNLWLDDIPEEVKSLNALEMHLVSIVQPFMKIVPLPRGGQKGIRGQMVCVPANLQRTADSLPWTLNTNNLIRVKLKRKQQYKGHHLYMVVNQERVMSALRKLMEINPAYKGRSYSLYSIIPKFDCRFITLGI